MDGDGVVKIEDVIMIIDIILGITPQDAAADVNADGKIGIDDVSDLIDLIMNQTPL